MKRVTRHRRSAIIVLILASSVFLLAKCIDKKEDAKSRVIAKVQREQFAGSETCISCHKNIYDTHIHTAHYLTTRPASEQTIKGSFEPGKNSFVYDSGMVVVMEKRDSGFYQVGYYKAVERVTKRFDMVFGSGSKGQTYVCRMNNRLYQLPVSYFTAAKEWANSPQYPTHPVIFNRSITSRCLECHSTFAKKISAPNFEPEEFDNNQMIYGVDCEKCHGPAARHVEFQSQNPKETKAKYIINPAVFSRQQTMDLCALCHGGRLQKTKPSFEFIAGDKLSNYFALDNSPPDPDNIDVHGNQAGLLRASKCFKMSVAMTCLTCHHAHENERGKIALFSQRCMGCHNSEHGNSCKISPAPGFSLSRNCIDCHMPLKASKSIAELLPGEKIPTAALIRSHFISVYPDETKKFKANPHKFD
jgi:Cytochrome c554 and c-prime